MNFFSSGLIADYDIFKSLVFAGVSLNEIDFNLFRDIFYFMTKDLFKSNLVIYLLQSSDQLLKNISKRGRSFEKTISRNYLDKIKQLAKNVSDPASNVSYPSNINTKAKQALYDNLENDEELSLVLDEAVRYNKLDGWRDGGIKEKKLRIEVNKLINDPQKTMELMDIIKAQNEY
jgi:deoxyadenosine/deoxycytidine kinase